MAQQRDPSQNLRKLSQQTNYLFEWNNKGKLNIHPNRMSLNRIQSKSEQKSKYADIYMYIDEDEEQKQKNETSAQKIKLQKTILTQITFPILYPHHYLNDKLKMPAQINTQNKQPKIRQSKYSKEMCKIIEREIQKVQKNIMLKTKINLKSQYITNHRDQMKQTFIRNMKLKLPKTQKEVNYEINTSNRYDEQPIKEIKRIINLNARRRSLNSLQKINLFKQF